MAQKKIDWEPLTWLGDRNVRAMTKSQRSDYCDLLCMMMLEDDGGIEANDEKLKDELKITEEDLAVIKVRLTERNGRYYQKKLKRDHDKKYKKRIQPEPLFSTTINVDLENEDLNKAWQNWKKYRTEIGFPLTETQITQQVIFLKSKPKEDAIEIINQSINCKWRGLFDLKKQYNGTSSTSNSQNLRPNTIEPEQGQGFGGW